MMRSYAVILALATLARAATFSHRSALGCETQADVTFVLDSSDNVGRTNFQKQLQFVNGVVRDLHIDHNKVQVSAVTFSNGVHNQFYLNGYGNKQDVVNAMGRIPYQGGRTHTADALKFVTQTSFSPLHGARNNIPHIAVLVTDSASNSPDVTKLEAQQAKDNGIVLYTVGVGGGTDTAELKAIASDPDSRYALKSESFDSLSSLSDLLSTKICNELPSNPTLLPNPSSCLNKADVVFLVDSSTSVGNANFHKMEHFLKDAVTRLNVGANNVHVGLMEYSSYPSLQFPLNMYTNRAELLKAIENMNYMGGGTNTADALKYMREQVYSQNAGARGNVPRIAIVVTNGGSSNPAATTTEADNARMQNIGLLAVGVGPNVNMNELHSIADNPAADHTFTVGSYADLDTITDQILAKACQVHATAPSLTTPRPGATLPPDTCVDKQNNCAQFGTKVCQDYRSWAMENCKRYCSFCLPLYTVSPPQCIDQLSNCVSYGRDTCSHFTQWAKEKCPKFCGFCGGQSKTSPLGFYGRCSYKSKSYATGEKWTDGCDYECVCQDGTSGKYQCYNRCPVYYNLPNECTLVSKPGDCCLKPVCNFKPKVNTIVSSGLGTTSSGTPVCVYKGRQYFQKQTWRDGCQFQCTCFDAAKGSYRCEELCPSYGKLPSTCKLEQVPGECCQKPVCEFNQQQGSFLGSGSITGTGIGMTYSTPPPCIDKVNNCPQYGKDVCQKFAGWATDNCKKFCDKCQSKEQNPGPDDKCVYEGKPYSQGQSWTVGCDTQCTCETAAYGYYRCVNSCPTYTNLPTGCHVIKETGDCCSKVKCDTGNFVSSTTNLGSIGNGGMISVINPSIGSIYVQPTVPSGGLPVHGAGGTGYQAPTLNGCLYKGDLYVQNQMWEDGCKLSCTCQNATTGLYSCRQKCPAYQSLPSSCHFETDTNDPCCQTPKCSRDPTTGKTFVPIPFFQKATIGHGAVQPPSATNLYAGTDYTGTIELFPTGQTPAAPTAGTGNGKAGFCTYKGHQYKHAETWEDGCDYNCVCDDGAAGHYRCVEKCITWGDLPKQYCHLERDPANPCCQIPKCNIPFHYVTNQGLRSTPTPSSIPPTPHTDVCVYRPDGHQYKQGQVWYDGCDKRCSCDDASKDFYRCMDRCPKYDNVPPNCSLIPDPQDPTCCYIPDCHLQQSTQAFTGHGTRPTTLVPPLAPTPSPAPGGNYTGIGGAGTGFCVYKQVSYKQGQKWQDGCDFNCECVDDKKGVYSCSDLCPNYVNMPAGCRLVTDFTNPCCKKPRCEPNAVPTPKPGVSPSPGMPTPTPKPRSFCTYHNAQYVQGQTWDDGCKYRCRCDDADKQLYTCSDRCAKFNTLPASCRLVTDPKDSCCLVPECKAVTPSPLPGQSPTPYTGAPTPYLIPTVAPGKIQGAVNQGTPTPRPGAITPTPGPGGMTPTPKPVGFCVYKGNTYHQGQTWEDGCDYNCRCEDQNTGHYVCTQKCASYNGLPTFCRLVRDPANPCCEKPECNVPPFTPTQGPPLTPSLGPHVSPPTPGVSQSPPQPGASTQGPTLRPPVPKGVCVYKGKSYTQGQQWFDGCDYNCVCEDASAGVYRCGYRCGQYASVPAGCTMERDPKDPDCCKIPQCHLTPNFSNPNQPIPTLPPVHIDGGKATPTPGVHNNPTPTPGLTPSPGTGPTLKPPMTPGGPTPSPSPPSVTPSYKNVCVYKGKTYIQGQKWQDGCEYDCICTDGRTGQYRCSEKCPKYPTLPAECKLVRDAFDPCCQKPFCSPSVTAAPPLGTTLKPPIQTGPTPKPAVCVYRGVAYKQGQAWADGCDLKCTCENGMTGFYRCNDRCPHYPQVPSSCTMETDPRDSCCRVPVCKPRIPPTPAPQPTPGPQPTGPDGHTLKPPLTPSPGPFNTPSPGTPQVPFPLPTAIPGVVSGTGVFPGNHTKACIYHGVVYKQGDKWQDGCSYDCECIDEHSGLYRCKERCALYLNLEANCRLVVDPKDACCKTPECTPPINLTPRPTIKPPVGHATQAPPLVSTLAPTPYTGPPTQRPPTPSVQPTVRPTVGPPMTTPVPRPKDVCVMKGQMYTQGQQWYDGCSKACVCEDGHTGFYRCNDRCAKYTNVPASCRLVPDPKDPQCCEVPQCIQIPGLNGNPTPSPTDKPVIITGVPTAFITGGNTPPTVHTPSPPPGQTTPAGQTPSPGPKSGVCVYNGKQYAQGQRWQDGCKYNCECVDGMNGKYKCTERCPTFPVLPPQCKMVRDSKDFCCFVPLCDWKPTASPPVTKSPSFTGPTLTPPNPHTLSPPTQTTPVPTPPAFCVYKGVAYRQGQTWTEGCTKKCRCDNADKNLYTCFDRCPSYNNLPASCRMETNSNDPCCQVPVCNPVTATPPLQPTPQPTAKPTPDAHGHFPTLAPGLPSTPHTNAPKPLPFPIPQPTGSVIGGPQPSPNSGGLPTNIGYCEYKGKQYKQGQKWEDGCDLKCECIDQNTGRYRCIERCPHYNSLPSYCHLVQNPMDRCCKIPDCPGVPNPFSSPTPPSHTVSPPTGPTLSPQTLNPVTPTPNTPSPPKDVCVYKGKSFTQGQTFFDGCDKKCVCQDGMTGYYTCMERCPTYNAPPACIMVPDSSDPLCCQVPQCNTNSTIPIPVTGSVTGIGTPTPMPQPTPYPPGYTGPTPTLSPSLMVTPTPYPPGYTGPRTTHAPTPTPYPPGYTGPTTQRTPKPFVTPTPYPPGYTGVRTTVAPILHPTPQPQPKVCVYNGRQYNQGQKWQDGCKYNCECVNGMTGLYRCNDRCPRYPNLSPSCRLQIDPQDPCCQKPVCTPVTPTPYHGPPTLAPTPYHGPPTLAPTPFPNPVPQVCVYQGVAYKQGQEFKVGCEKTCRCEDGMTGRINCNERCPTYPALKAGCTLVTDPNDPCCQVPKCVNPNPKNPYQVVVGVPGTVTGGPSPNPNNPNPGSFGRIDRCVYKGKTYQQGQKWDDGCTYQCECMDANSGKYRCDEKCPRFPQIPPTCTLVQDSAKVCCQKVFCPVNLQPTPQHVTVAPPLGGTTKVPPLHPTAAPTPHGPVPKGMCVYKGQNYQQGQQWYDACNAICRCEDASVNYYRCQQRCGTYPSLSPACTLVPDPKDPSCCEIAKCPVTPPVGVTPTPGIIHPPTPPKPFVTGIGSPPTPSPSPVPTRAPGATGPVPTAGPTPAPKPGCFFKGKMYTQGQTWQDGCDYNCVCDDQMTGHYKCTDRCNKFPNLDSRCVLVSDPKDKCCGVPYCDFVNPTPFPHGRPTPFMVPTPSAQTPAPWLVPTLSPSPLSTNKPQPQGFCVYKGVYYKQGQKWQDGCSQNCVCEDPQNGLYTCTQRCQSFPNVPSQCTLSTDPNDPCCLVPVCNSFPTPRPTLPGGQPVPTPTPGPGQTTPSPIIYPVGVPNVITGHNNYNPNGGNPTFGSRAACVYKGNVYTQGQKWDDGCSYQCECVDADKGQYRCTGRCPRYYNLPAQCVYKADPSNTCCKKAVCDMSLIPTTHKPVTVGVNTPNTVTGTNSPTDQQCTYKDGKKYHRGDTWNDGCLYSCVCENPAANIIKCNSRCQVFSGLPLMCTLVPDPKDSCCQVPKCSAGLTPITGGGNVVPGPGVTGAIPTPGTTPNPKLINLVPIGTHNSFTGVGVPQPGQTIAGKRTDCVYKGKIHKQGESWNDGCQLVCTCQNGQSGLYRCVSKCPQYPKLPAYCKMVNVPGQCCPSMSCNIAGHGVFHPQAQLNPTPAPTIGPNGQIPTTHNPLFVASGNRPIIGNGKLPGGGFPVNSSQISGINDKCIYHNRLYNQGQKWKDGCQYKCECIDANSGYYECTPGCPTYNNLPPQCYKVRNNGGCCDQIFCQNPDGNTVNALTQHTNYPIIGTFSNNGISGFRPGYKVPGSATGSGTTVTGHRDGCVYKSKTYKQGESWDDACDFHCTCENGQFGIYRCQAKCPKYTNLPAQCRLVASTVQGDCCKKVKCGTVMTTPNTPQASLCPDQRDRDLLDNCDAYGQVACGGQYEAWARRNCAFYCGFKHCGNSAISTATPQCHDKISNCFDYGHTACTGIYAAWAKDNCASYCSLCSTTPSQMTTSPLTTPMTTAHDACHDKIDCAPFTSFCTQIAMEAWAKTNCPKTCNKCPVAHGTVVPVIGNGEIIGGTDNGYLLLLKGVAGVPGDLFKLWSSSRTENPNVPQASTLTSAYKGHYKPDFSNHWNDFCFDKVKVSIYNGGVRKAWVEFNAQGTDKMGWFKPERIIGSSWSDLKTAQKNIFSMAGDASLGRQFYASMRNTGCDGFGWFMVSTKNNGCFYESGTHPAFYYSPKSTAAHWGFDNPGSGDVFAIQAHSTCKPGSPGSTGSTTINNHVCIYKNKAYNQGDNWVDGCDYNCTCEDASIGFYRCKGLCPVYSSIPKGCTLDKPSGQCCSKMKCVGNPGDPFTVVPQNACYYKQKYYGQDQTWDDGCLYKCRCVEAKTGNYQCSNKCLQWQLPPACHLQDPKPGKCCKTPSCPKEYIINYPAGYTEQ